MPEVIKVYKNYKNEDYAAHPIKAAPQIQAGEKGRDHRPVQRPDRRSPMLTMEYDQAISRTLQ
jgi:hypothetical protein